jgi:hypothetical protein
MGSKSEGGVMDIHHGNKTNVDLCRISLVEKNTSNHFKKTIWSYPADYLLGYDRLYEHHTYGSNRTIETLLGLLPLQLVVVKKARQAAYRLHCSIHFKKSDRGHSAIFKMATEDFPILLTVCLWRYLIGNIW